MTLAFGERRYNAAKSRFYTDSEGPLYDNFRAAYKRTGVAIPFLSKIQSDTRVWLGTAYKHVSRSGKL